MTRTRLDNVANERRHKPALGEHQRKQGQDEPRPNGDRQRKYRHRRGEKQAEKAVIDGCTVCALFQRSQT